MSVESHGESQPVMPARPGWAWGESQESAAPAAAAPEPAAPAEPAPTLAPEPPVVAGGDRPAWSWGAPPPAPGVPAAAAPAVSAAAAPAAPAPAVPAVSAPERNVPPPYVAVRAPQPPGLLAGALARARAGVAGATPVDRTAARIQRVLVMGLLVAGWALSLSSPVFAVVLPVVAALLLVATASPALSLPRLISARVLPAARLAGPRLTAEDPAPHRLSDAVTGLVLVLASLCAIAGVQVVAWTLGWAVIAVALLEFTFDVSLATIVHTRLRQAGLLRS